MKKSDYRYLTGPKAPVFRAIRHAALMRAYCASHADGGVSMPRPHDILFEGQWADIPIPRTLGRTPSGREKPIETWGKVQRLRNRRRQRRFKTLWEVQVLEYTDEVQ